MKLTAKQLKEKHLAEKLEDAKETWAQIKHMHRPEDEARFMSDALGNRRILPAHWKNPKAAAKREKRIAKAAVKP